MRFLNPDASHHLGDQNQKGDFQHDYGDAILAHGTISVRRTVYPNNEPKLPGSRRWFDSVGAGRALWLGVLQSLGFLRHQGPAGVGVQHGDAHGHIT